MDVGGATADVKRAFVRGGALGRTRVGVGGGGVIGSQVLPVVGPIVVAATCSGPVDAGVAEAGARGSAVEAVPGRSAVEGVGDPGRRERGDLKGGPWPLVARVPAGAAGPATRRPQLPLVDVDRLDPHRGAGGWEVAVVAGLGEGGQAKICHRAQIGQHVAQGALGDEHPADIRGGLVALRAVARDGALTPHLTVGAAASGGLVSGAHVVAADVDGRFVPRAVRSRIPIAGNPPVHGARGIEHDHHVWSNQLISDVLEWIELGFGLGGPHGDQNRGDHQRKGQLSHEASIYRVFMGLEHWRSVHSTCHNIML